jgi:protein SCO1/2
MNARTSQIVLVLSSFLGGLVLFAGIILFVSGQFSSGSVLAPSAIGGPFKLVDQDGKPITQAALDGHPSLVFFGYTHCPDVCPTTLFELSEVMRALGPDAGKALALFVSVDPDRDTPAVMKDYLSSFDPHLRGVTGDPKALDAMEKEYRVYAKKVPTGNDGDYSMDHSAIVYLMDKQGRFVAPFNLKQKPQEAAAELRKYM